MYAALIALTTLLYTVMPKSRWLFDAAVLSKTLTTMKLNCKHSFWSQRITDTGTALRQYQLMYCYQTKQAVDNGT